MHTTGPNTPTDHLSDITCVAFDFGRVVVDWDPRHLFRQVFTDHDEMEHFLAHVLTPDENLRLDLGMPLAELVADLVERHPDSSVALEAWRDRWVETIPGPIAGTADLIAELLGAGLRVVGLSNFSAETFALVRRPNDVFDAMHDIVLSGHHGVAKPDPAIFELLCKRNAVQPHNVVFFDDAVGNVTAAARLGFHSRLFTDAATARHDLVELRVLDATPGAADAARTPPRP